MTVLAADNNNAKQDERFKTFLSRLQVTWDL